MYLREMYEPISVFPMTILAFGYCSLSASNVLNFVGLYQLTFRPFTIRYCSSSLDSICIKKTAILFLFYSCAIL